MKIDKLELIGKIKGIIGSHGYVGADQFYMDDEDFDHAAEEIAELFRDSLRENRFGKTSVCTFDDDYQTDSKGKVISFSLNIFDKAPKKNEYIYVKFVEEENQEIGEYIVTEVDTKNNKVYVHFIG
jgi:hypothetical protein